MDRQFEATMHAWDGSFDICPRCCYELAACVCMPSHADLASVEYVDPPLPRWAFGLAVAVGLVGLLTWWRRRT